MFDVKTAGVRELKAQLSSYLRDVARGETVLVTDRGRVVAELRPPGAADRDASPEELRRRALIASGRLRPATAPGSYDMTRAPRIGLPPGTAQALLDAEREEGP
jgi:prevent-host-death family protein